MAYQPTPTEATVNDALRAYGFTGGIHAAIDLLGRAARTLAPQAAEEALDTGNTNDRPTGPRTSMAWDLQAVAHALNAVSA